jgi:hypothetical protein
VTTISLIHVTSLDHCWINRLQLDVDETLGGVGGTFQKLGARRRSQGLARASRPTIVAIWAHLRSGVFLCPLEPSSACVVVD